MSYSTWWTDEPVGEGQGYTDAAVKSSSSVGSSVLGSAGEENQQEVVVEEEEVGIEVDATREGTDIAPPPVVTRYGWAPHKVGLYAPFYITSASLEYLVSRMSILASTGDAESMKLVVCRMNKQACHGQEGYDVDLFYVYTTLFRDLGVRLPFMEF